MASNKPPANQQARSVAKSSSLLERASAQFGDFQRKAFSLPLAAVPQLEWEKEAFAAAQRDAQMQEMEAALLPHEAQVGQRCMDAPQSTASTGAVKTSPRPEEIHRLDHPAMRRVGLIVPGDEATSLSEEFRILRREVMSGIPVNAGQTSVNSAQVALVCSPHSGEGKTFTAINLALSIASELGQGGAQREVVLIDADCMKPSIARLLGIPAGPGLLDALANPAFTPEDCLTWTDCAGLRVLTAGAGSEASGDALTGPRMQHILAQLGKNNPNRIIIIDTPPALVASVAAEIAPHAGQCLLIARAGVPFRPLCGGRD